MQGHGEDASASWRVLVALRLLHLRLPRTAQAMRGNGTTASSSSLAQALEPWYDVLSGDADIISSSNEQQVTSTIKTICGVVKLQAMEGIPRCEALGKQWSAESDVATDARVSLHMLEGIWREDLRIAEAVLNNLD